MGQLAAISRYVFGHVSERLGRPVRFVQIGAHDGHSGDPIHDFILRYGWQGLLVEPVPFLFADLKQTYRGVAELVFENCAVGEEAGTKTFYAMRPRADAPVTWHSQLSSFDREVILKHRDEVPDLERYIEEIAVRTERLDQLLDRHSIWPDLLVIDTEGHDYKVLRSYDCTRHRPQIIYFEHRHLQEDERREALALMMRLGLIAIFDHENCLALDAQAVPASVLTLIEEMAGSARPSIALNAVPGHAAHFATVDALSARVAQLERAQKALLGSTSWRVTAPLRGLVHLLRGVRPGSAPRSRPGA